MSAEGTRPAGAAAEKSVVWTGVFLGIGAVGAADEIVFHQMLQWHNFYVHTDQYWRIFSDGAFHVFTTGMLLLAAIRLWAARRRLSAVVRSRLLWAGVLLGVGGFQLFDGIVNHKVLQLHPVREGVENIWIYDLAWNIPAALVLLAGWLVWRGLRAADHVTSAVEEDAGRDRRHRAA